MVLLCELGGLCGENRGTIGKCYSTGSVTASSYSSNIGGLCGENYGGYGGTISNCYSSVSVTGVHDSYSFGGLCGLNHHFSTISNCYSEGSVQVLDYCEYVGGLCGENLATIRNCYSSASVWARYDPWWIGGLVGFNSYGVISNCYFLYLCGPDNGHGTVLTSSQMKEQHRFVGWDFVGEETNGRNDYWRMCVDGVSFPLLSWEFGGDLVCPDGVDFLDYSYFSGHWKDGGCHDSNDCARTDLDFSGAIDWGDLNIFCDHWLEGAGE